MQGIAPSFAGRDLHPALQPVTWTELGMHHGPGRVWWCDRYQLKQGGWHKGNFRQISYEQQRKVLASFGINTDVAGESACGQTPF